VPPGGESGEAQLKRGAGQPAQLKAVAVVVERNTVPVVTASSPAAISALGIALPKPAALPQIPSPVSATLRAQQGCPAPGEALDNAATAS